MSEHGSNDDIGKTEIFILKGRQILQTVNSLYDLFFEFALEHGGCCSKFRLYG